MRSSRAKDGATKPKVLDDAEAHSDQNGPELGASGNATDGISGYVLIKGRNSGTITNFD